MTTEARAFWTTAPGRGEIRTEPLSDPGPDDVLVRTIYSGISRGTESLVFQGLVPPSEYERMRAPFQSGTFALPIKYGYANVGVVEAGKNGFVGQRVFSLFPHQTHFVIPAGAAHPIPEAIPPRRAVLAANLETAINGLWDAEVQAGDRVTVIGAGVVGSLVAWLAGRIPGCHVQLVDTVRSRLSIASSLGVAFAMPENATPERDVVVHASGAPEGLATALRLAAFEGIIVEMSWYGTREVTVPLGEAFHAKRLTLRSSQVGHIAPRQRARWDNRRRMGLALELLVDPALDVLLTGDSAFEALPQTMAALVEPGKALCHVVRY